MENLQGQKLLDMSVAEIAAMVAESELTDELLQVLDADSRKGVGQIARRARREADRRQSLHTRASEMAAFDRALATSENPVAGIDEAGAGPLAGPVVAASVVLPPDYRGLGINDSKQLRAAQRDELAREIREVAIAIGVAVVHADEIDQVNIYRASHRAMVRAYQAMGHRADTVLVDARELDELPENSYGTQKAIVAGDSQSLAIAAASIIAKVARDGLMKHYAALYPGYGFEKHKGYGTKLHLDALEVLGPSPIHRKSFGPVRRLLGGAKHLPIEQGQLSMERSRRRHQYRLSWRSKAQR